MIRSAKTRPVTPFARTARRSLTGLVALAMLASPLAAAPAQANGGKVLGALIGGALIGGIIAAHSRPAYAGTVYVEDGYGECWKERRIVGHDGFDVRWRGDLDLGLRMQKADRVPQQIPRLDDSVLNSVIQRNGAGLGQCLLKTGSRSASIVFIVRGNGRVSDVMVNGQTGGELAGCIRARMQAMQFPSFNGPRTKGSFTMSL